MSAEKEEARSLLVTVGLTVARSPSLGALPSCDMSVGSDGLGDYTGPFADRDVMQWTRQSIGVISGNVYMHCLALEDLGRYPEYDFAFGHLAELILSRTSHSPLLVLAAIRNLGRHRTKRAILALLNLTQSGVHQDLQSAVYEALDESYNLNFLLQLVEAQDLDAQTRSAMLRLFAHIGKDDGAVQALLARLATEDSTSSLAQSIMDERGRVSIDEEDLAPVEEDPLRVITHDDVQAVEDVLGGLEPEDSISPLAFAPVRLVASGAGESEIPDLSDDLLPEEEQKPVKGAALGLEDCLNKTRFAAKSVGSEGDQSGSPSLRSLLEGVLADENLGGAYFEQVKKSEFCPAVAQELVKMALEDSDHRMAAIWALRFFPSVNVLSALDACLGLQSDDPVACAAREVLDRWGKSMVQTIRKKMQDQGLGDPQVSAAAE